MEENRREPSPSPAANRRDFLQSLAAGIAFVAAGGGQVLGQSLCLGSVESVQRPVPWWSKTKSYSNTFPIGSGTMSFPGGTILGSGQATAAYPSQGTWTEWTEKPGWSQSSTETVTYSGPQSITISNTKSWVLTPPLLTPVTYSGTGRSLSFTVFQDPTVCTYEGTLTQSVTYTTTTWHPFEPEPRNVVIEEPVVDDETGIERDVLGSLDAATDLRDVRTRMATKFQCWFGSAFEERLVTR